MSALNPLAFVNNEFNCRSVAIAITKKLYWYSYKSVTLHSRMTTGNELNRDERKNEILKNHVVPQSNFDRTEKFGG